MSQKTHTTNAARVAGRIPELFLVGIVWAELICLTFPFIKKMFDSTGWHYGFFAALISSAFVNIPWLIREIPVYRQIALKKFLAVFGGGTASGLIISMILVYWKKILSDPEASKWVFGSAAIILIINCFVARRRYGHESLW